MAPLLRLSPMPSLFSAPPCESPMSEAIALFVEAGGPDWLDKALLGLAAVLFVAALLLSLIAMARSR